MAEVLARCYYRGDVLGGDRICRGTMIVGEDCLPYIYTCYYYAAAAECRLSGLYIAASFEFN